MKALRAGKKRLLDVRRQPNGKAIRTQEPAITPEAQAKREALCRGDKDLAKTEAPGRASALLVIWEILTLRQAEALERYRAAILAYRSVAGFPPCAPQIANIASMPDEIDADASAARRWWETLTPEEEAERVRRIITRASDLYEIVGTGTLRRQIVDRIAIDDVAPPLWSEGIYSPQIVGVLRRVCDELAAYFRLPVDER